MPIMSKTQASYLAGLIDAEGYVGLLKERKGNRKKGWDLATDHTYIPVLKVKMTDKWMIEWLKESFGGTLEVQYRKEPSWRDCYGWKISYAKAMNFIACVRPYLKVKRSRAELLMKFGTGKRNLESRGQFSYVNDKEWQRRESIYQQMRKLNKRGVQGERPSEPNIPFGYKRWPTPLGNRRVTKLERAYIAGLIDGDGWFGKKSSLTIAIELTNKDTIMWLGEKLGGVIHSRRQRNPNAKISYKWCVANNVEAKRILQKIEPYLRLKRELAQDILSS